MQERETWFVHDAIGVSFDAFVKRFGSDLLWQAFERMTRDRLATLVLHGRYAHDLDQYLGQPLEKEGADLVVWMANARLDPVQADLLILIGVRWWMARDDMLTLPPMTKIPKIYNENSSKHVSLQLLTQMLYRGAAPDSATC